MLIARKPSPATVWLPLWAMGDPACFLSNSCLICGRFLAEEDRDRKNCVQCGERLVGEDPGESVARDKTGQVVSGPSPG